MFLQKYFFVFYFLLIPIAYANAPDINSISSSKRPLVLQWQVSQSRNTHQISLIFRQDTVELVTNTSSYQKDKFVRLGRFKSSVSPELKEWKKQIESVYNQLKTTVPVSALIKHPRVRPGVHPHAPVLHINEEKIQREHPDFKPMANIIYKVWEKEWICVECATYTKKGKFIIRTIRLLDITSDNNTAGKTKNQSKPEERWKVTEQKFEKKRLNCLSKGKNKVECVDLQFGIFEI